MQTHTISQNYTAYTEEDHQTWSKLSSRQCGLQNGKISEEYMSGFEKLRLDPSKIVNIEELSGTLQSISGWTLIPVSGLIPTRDFFYMLINKKYPVTVSIRRPWEIDFSEQPDIFHDVYGHLPLLTNERFIKFLTLYSIIALKYVNNERAVDFLGRLYWYTYEMGIILEDGKYKPFGGAIITSAEEIANMNNPAIPKHAFDLDKIFHTVYNPYKLQSEYFVIDSFNDLFDSLQHLESRLIEHLLLPDKDYTIRNYPLNASIGKGFRNVIGFLNDVQFKYPEAISFVAGQPDENFFSIEENISKFKVYVDYMAKKTGQDRTQVINKIGQYSKTKGIINDILSEYLRKEENIHVKEDHILVTTGAQEAFAVIVSTICNRSNDVILMEDPAYIGLSSFARIFDYSIEGIKSNDEGIDLKCLRNRIIESNRSGKNIKMLYVIPDYQNPTGVCMPIGNRLKLLELAQQYNFLIIEDSVYNSFTYLQKKNPTLKSLDRYNRVIYVGSFSKSLFPGLRVGFIVSNQEIENDQGEQIYLIDEMVKVKAQVTNNTSTISQAIVGGILLEQQFTFSEASASKYRSYRMKRDSIVNALEKYIGVYRSTWAKGIYWNKPDGGFFLKFVLPFDIESEMVVECARKYNVIFCPMQFFYSNENDGKDEIRLTFSNLSLEQIDEGIASLALFLEEHSKARKLVSKEVEPALLQI